MASSTTRGNIARPTWRAKKKKKLNASTSSIFVTKINFLDARCGFHIYSNMSGLLIRGELDLYVENGFLTFQEI